MDISKKKILISKKRKQKLSQVSHMPSYNGTVQVPASYYKELVENKSAQQAKHLIHNDVVCRLLDREMKTGILMSLMNCCISAQNDLTPEKMKDIYNQINPIADAIYSDIKNANSKQLAPTCIARDFEENDFNKQKYEMRINNNR